MEYRHYWKIEYEIPLYAFKRIQAKAAEFAQQSYSDVSIAINTHPEYLSLYISGVHEESQDTFLLTPGIRNYDYCNTAHKPYDEVVVAVLNYAGHNYLKWWSDGDSSDHFKGMSIYTGTNLPYHYTCSEEPEELVKKRAAT
tara:strand:- start:340 stop:762 length:423 start_codon:yes stop_codon:yes gene_type:complete